MNNLILRMACPTVIAACYFVTLSTLATDYRNPNEVKLAISQIMQRPQSGPTECFFASGISHFDGFIPHNSGMVKTYDLSKPHYKYTYQDGRVIKCEFFDSSGKLSEYCAVWNDGNGAPVLSGGFRGDGTGEWYMFAEYGPSGKIQTLYRFGNDFELQRYEEFSYEEGATHIKTFTRNSKLRSETLYEKGEVFIITNGEKRKVNNANRENDIRSLAKFGLKPLYPGY